MTDGHIVQTLVEYHVASNRRLWAHIVEHLTDAQFVEDVGYAHGSLRNQIVHVAVTDRYWLHDVQVKPVTGLNPEDYPTRESFTSVFEEIEDALLQYVRSLNGPDFEVTPQGLTLSRGEALAHVVNHGTDHRAQILSMLHGLGAPTFEQDLGQFLHDGRMLSKEQVLDLITFRRGQWKEALAGVPQQRLEELVLGQWSIKDVVAHITWHDREMLGVLRTRKLAGSPWWDLPLEERNRRIHEQLRDQPLAQVLREHDEVHEQLLVELERLEDEDLNDGARIEGMIPGADLGGVLEENTWGHYLVHTESLWESLGWGPSAAGVERAGA